jgi:polyribonucleotide nucleotidyltransferase
MEKKRFEIKIGEETLIAEVGDLARQADGAVRVQCGGTVVLVTAVMSKEVREGMNFLPLTVEYRERTYAAGKIPGGFFKREGRPSEKEVLSARLIDRPIRPLFPEGLRNDIQIVATVLSSDGIYDPDILSMIGASMALSISEIPFAGPLSSIRVACKEGQYIANPTYQDIEEASLSLTIASTIEGVVMLEGEAKEASKEEIEQALKAAQAPLKEILNLQDKMTKEIGIEKCRPELKVIDPEVLNKARNLSENRLDELNKMSSREERVEFLSLLSKEIAQKLIDETEEIRESDVKEAVEKIEKEHVRKHILNNKKRPDGRKYEDIRSIDCQIGILPRTHGSGLFTRGQTQSLAVVTLGTTADEQRIDALAGESSKSFMLHYNFPPFSVGETRPMRGPGRREIGHGALAEKALKPVIPGKEEFPYTIRVVSDILESNGSSSMASVCAASLALMDAGTPIKDAVAGIALGLVKEGDETRILTDIAGLEDHFGDMDFKIAGTKKGITVIQTDVKISGISLDLISEVLAQAERAKLVVLEKMNEVIDKPKSSLSKYAPRIEILHVPIEKIGKIIGPSGKTIRKIIQETGASIDIEDDGTVLVSSTDPESSKRAIQAIEGFTKEPEVGKVYLGKVAKIMDFGAFVEFLPQTDGLVHVSELSGKFVEKVQDVVKVGDELPVKVIGIDDLGRVKLSAKQVTPDEKDKLKD